MRTFIQIVARDDWKQLFGQKAFAGPARAQFSSQITIRGPGAINLCDQAGGIGRWRWR